MSAMYQDRQSLPVHAPEKFREQELVRSLCPFSEKDRCLTCEFLTQPLADARRHERGM